jgi:hypothetical protein
MRSSATAASSDASAGLVRLLENENTVIAIETGRRAREILFAPPALVACLLLGLTLPSHADSDGAIVLGEYVTVLTLASDGAWGTATEPSTSRAIAFAIRDCKTMSRRVIGCGAKFTTVRTGWSVAVLCGDETIIAAATQLADAERMAIKREMELREVYRRNMPPCVRVATVNPNGVVVAPVVQAAKRR